MKQMTRRERIVAALHRQPVDRVPYAFWRHFPSVDRSPAGFAQATLRFHDRYGSDFLTITPRGGYAVEAWGCVESEHELPDGHRPCLKCAVRDGEDWKKIRPLDPTSAPGWVDQIEIIVRLGFDRRIGDAPVLPTLSSPLSIARKLSGTRLDVDLRERPGLVRDALDAITETLVAFAAAALAEGVSGIFYSIQAASRLLHTDAEYEEFGEPYDRRVLESAREKSMLTIVHAHGDDLMFEPVARLPADAWSWADRSTPPSLARGQELVPGAVIGGLDGWRTLRDGTADDTTAEVKDAIAQTNGTGLIVGAGGALPMRTPDATVAAAVRALGGPLKPLPGVAL